MAGSVGKQAFEKDIASRIVYLSAILLTGLLLNLTLGWWWADPLAALVMVPIIAEEGIDGIRAKVCCD